MKKEELSIYKKMTPEELQGLLQMRRRNSRIAPKKGKGSYRRKGKYSS